MQALEIVKAWKEEDYRDTLTAERRAKLPEHPAGVIEFDQPELEDETSFKGGKIPHGKTYGCTVKGNCK